MLTVAEALERVTSSARRLPPVRSELRVAVGCVLAENIACEEDQPPFDKALVDGYAVRSQDVARHARRLKVSETILAGQTSQRLLAPGEAAQIMTGAPLPPGADAVVMHEETTVDGEFVQLGPTDPRPGQNLLRKGRVLEVGTLVLRQGTRLGPTEVALLAMLGRTQVDIFPRPSLAILATGDELVEPGQVPGPGQIRNSNTLLLETLAWQEGVAAQGFPIVRDEPRELLQAVSQGLTFDVLVLTGGVSAGQRDLVPAVLEELGVQRIFHKIRLKPGKPLWFGVGPKRGDRPGALVFGLPGNPVSALVGFHLFVKPAVRLLSGREDWAEEAEEARLAMDHPHRGDRPTYHPARIIRPRSSAKQPIEVELLPWAGSADLVTLAQADGLAVFPAGDRDFRSGQIVPFVRLR